MKWGYKQKESLILIQATIDLCHFKRRNLPPEADTYCSHYSISKQKVSPVW